MTNEEKQLVLKALCTRLPYGVKVSVSGDDFDNYQYPYLLTAISKFEQDILCKVYSPIYIPLGCPSIENVKPYLRPIKSMTKGECNELFKILSISEKNGDWIKINDIGVIRLFTELGKDFYEIADAMDYLYSIHIDFRDLIEKGLALEAPEGMYKTK